jgi:diguanylate cyclase (GGDEF)-like protein
VDEENAGGRKEHIGGTTTVHGVTELTFASDQDPKASPGSLDIFVMMDHLSAAQNEVLQLQTQLLEARQQDLITGLPNRFRLADRTDQAILMAQRQERFVAIIIIDLDRFKGINQTLVFSERDELVHQVARRLVAPLRLGDTLAVVNSDQFAVLLPDLHNPLEPTRVAKNLLEALRIPFRVGKREINLTASLGISLYPEDGTDASTLQKQAESAANRAKLEGGNCVQCNTPTLSEAFLERRELETYLGESIAAENLEVFYQPQFDWSDNLIGVEALLRWHHPILGAVPPSKIIPLAEENHLIHTLGEWVLRTACRQAASWQALSPRPLRLAVNVSAHQVTHPNWVDSVARILRDTKLPPGRLELELTESSLLKNEKLGLSPLHELKGMGIRIGIDDFGTGYSSLSYLHRLPIDTLKIDQSFVRGLHPEPTEHSGHPEPSSNAIIQTILQLGENMNLEVIAEGVETEAQKLALYRLGCEVFQGFLLGRPMTAADLGSVLDAQQASAFEAFLLPRAGGS